MFLSKNWFNFIEIKGTEVRVIRLCDLKHQPQIGTFHGHLPSTSTRIESDAAAAADFQNPLKGVQGGEQK